MTDFFYSPFELKLASSPTGEFEGYGAVFGNTDLGGDQIAPGAFTRTLAEMKASGAVPTMYAQHGAQMGADARPIGVWTSITQDAHGLAVKGRIIGLETETGRFNHALVKEGAMRGLSIGYRAKASRPGNTANGGPRRIITDADLFEISIVDRPMNPMARISAVKSADEIKTITEFSRFLRNAGFSRSAATKLASGGWPRLSATPDDDVSDVVAILRNGISQITKSGKA